MKSLTLVFLLVAATYSQPEYPSFLIDGLTRLVPQPKTFTQLFLSRIDGVGLQIFIYKHGEITGPQGGIESTRFSSTVKSLISNDDPLFWSTLFFSGVDSILKVDTTAIRTVVGCGHPDTTVRIRLSAGEKEYFFWLSDRDWRMDQARIKDESGFHILVFKKKQGENIRNYIRNLVGMSLNGGKGCQ